MPLQNDLQKCERPAKFEDSRLEKSVMAAAQGLTIGAQVRENAVGAALLIRTEVKYCAVAFCAAPNTEPETIDECALTIVSHYSHLNVAEIREAFRLASIRQIDVDLSAYHGQFSVRILGGVLSAYDDLRAAAARQVRARLQAEQDAAENELRAEILKDKFGTLADQFAALIERNDRYEIWQDLPTWFCGRVVMEGIAKLTLEEKKAAWIAAKRWCVNNVGGWYSETFQGRFIMSDRRRFLTAIEAIRADADTFPEQIRPEAEAAYCKMLVFSKIAQYSPVKQGDLFENTGQACRNEQDIPS